MFLTKIIMNGFKSFADRTVFEFGDGVTAVVGPNGCGKSNLVDAIKWVLGEQSAKGLRGRQMLDMIFNGSGTRKSASLAQVDLVFDNTNGRLATDQTEVTVSRRLYRSGESEYLLNKQPCRLKDVKELFLDTGVGIGAYSIIEQGKVDLLLQANPQERRVVFEEAAGISRYKLRKREAQRKLERTEQNLLRIQDVIDEVQKRLRSVKLQAGKARNYKEYHGRLMELRSSYAMAEYHRMAEEIARLKTAVEAAGDKAMGFRRDIAALEARSSQLDVEEVQLEERITEIDRKLTNLQSSMTACEERITQSNKRRDEQREVLEQAEARLAEQESAVTRFGEDIETLTAELSRIDAAVQTSTARIETLNEEDRALAHAEAQAEADHDEIRSAIIETQRRQAQLNNDITSWAQRQETSEAQRDRLKTRQADVAAELSEKHREARELQAKLGSLDGSIDAKVGEIESLSERIVAVRNTLDERGRAMSEARERRSGVESKRQTLDEMERRREGVQEGVRRLLERRSQDEHDDAGIVGLVADLIETDTEHAGLIELALGEHQQSLVAAETQAFLQSVEALGEDAGRVSSFCLDRMAPVIGGRRFDEREGFVAMAIDWVRYAPQYEMLVRRLLGHVVIVDSIAAATAMGGEAGGYRFLTRNGVLLEPDGRVSAGRSGEALGLVSRKSELRELTAALADIDRQIAELEEQRRSTSEEAEALDKRQHDLRAELHALQGERIEGQTQLRHLEENCRRLGNEQPVLASEIDLLEGQIRDSIARSGEARERLEELAKLHEQQREREQDVAVRLADVGEQRETAATALTEARVEAGRLREQHGATNTRVNGVRQQRSQAEAACEKARREADECRRRIGEAEQSALDASEQLQTLTAEREHVSRDALQLRKDRDGVRLRLEEAAAEIKERRAALETVEGEQHKLEIDLEGVRTRRDELVARVRDELEIDLVQRYENYEHTDADWEAVENEIAELKQKISRLGNVNLDAIDELEELEMRDTFLTAQRDDLTSSKDELESLINELNAVCEERFLQTFEKSRIHFQELFRKLFGGGKANFVLEDETNVLDSGIEIVAQPPGKELQSITLMSGGEKTMTAIALLLAIFKSKPSPFAVLDEVDAALDEANNERYNRIVRDFTDQSQFILITHSKRTMSIADRMYGVTMQEAGVSKRVSVEFEDTSEAGGKGGAAAVA